MSAPPRPDRESFPDEVVHRGLHGDLRVDPAPPPLGPRVVVSLAWLVSISAFCLVALSALPAIARGMGVSRVRVVQRESPHARPIGRTGSDAVRDFEKDIGKSVEKHERDGAFEFAPATDDKLELLKIEHEVVLRSSPQKSATPLGTVQRGALVLVVKREGSWIQVLRELSEDSYEMGWIEERDLAP